MKMMHTVLRYGHSKCPPSCYSNRMRSLTRAEMSSLGMSDKLQKLKPQKLIEDSQSTCKLICCQCNVVGHNEQRPLKFISLQKLSKEMPLSDTNASITLRAVAKYHFMSVEQLMRLNTQFYVPSDTECKPTCECMHVQPDTFGFTGGNVSQDRKTENVERVVTSCSSNIHGHNYLLNITNSATLETFAQCPNLGLWPEATQVGLEDVDLLALDKNPRKLYGRSHSCQHMILCVREIFQEQVNGKEALHEWLKEPRVHIVGNLHGPLLGLTRFFFSMLQDYVHSKKKVPQFNRQQEGTWSIEYDVESKTQTPKQPSMMGPGCKRMVDLYSRAVVSHGNNNFSLDTGVPWPLRGILDNDHEPGNLQCFLAAIFNLKKCIDLADVSNLSPGKTSLDFRRMCQVLPCVNII